MFPDPLAPSPIPSLEEVDDVRALITEMGGKAFLGRHEDRAVWFSLPSGPRRVELASCGHRARISVPDPDEGTRRTILCVVCDCVQLMPRMSPA